MFLISILFPKLCVLHSYSPEDLVIARRFITECRIALDKKIMLPLLNKETVVIKTGGTLFYVKCLEDLYHALLCYEPETLVFIDNAVASGGTFVDVGSNIGGYSVRLARKSHVFAFEPHPLNYSLLCSNLKLNNLNGVTFNCAVSNTARIVKLFTSKYHGCHSLVHNNEGKFIKVNAITLDEALLEVKSIDLLKIDAEDAELDIFQGAFKTLLKTKIIVFEGSTSYKNMLAHDFLSRLGFRYIEQIDFSNRIYLNEKQAIA